MIFSYISYIARAASYFHSMVEKGRILHFIAGNVHIDYRRGDSTCGVLRSRTVTGCASCHSPSPENAPHLAGSGRAGPLIVNKGIKVTWSVSVLPVSTGEHRMRSFVHNGQRVLYMHTIKPLCRDEGYMNKLGEKIVNP